MRWLLCVAALLALPSVVLAAGTVTTTEVTHRPIKMVVFEWTSDASGDATATSTLAYTGEILAVVQDVDGVDTPTDNYDVTVTEDVMSYDVLNSTGVNLRNSGKDVFTKAAADEFLPLVETKLSLVVANAGNAKKGTTVLYIR